MDDFERLYNKALRFLSYRARSEKEIRERLQKAKAPIETIDKIIVKLKEYNFLNDVEFAKSWIENRIKLNPRSLKVIKMELRQKGISEEIIENLEFKVDCDKELAKKLSEKKAEKMKGLSKEEIQKKLYGYLTRRGFNYETIKRSVDEILRKGV